MGLAPIEPLIRTRSLLNRSSLHAVKPHGGGQSRHNFLVMISAPPGQARVEASKQHNVADRTDDEVHNGKLTHPARQIAFVVWRVAECQPSSWLVSPTREVPIVLPVSDASVSRHGVTGHAVQSPAFSVACVGDTRHFGRCRLLLSPSFATTSL